MIGAVTRNELRALLDLSRGPQPHCQALIRLAERKYRNFYLSERGRAFVEDMAKRLQALHNASAEGKS